MRKKLDEAKESRRGGEGLSQESQEQDFFSVYTRVAKELNSLSSSGMSKGNANKGLFPTPNSDIFVALFRCYNMAILSSATVERVF